jgi:hypothetical protein
MSLFENDFSGEDETRDTPLPQGFDVDSGCDRYALLLTSLFDGEASAAEEIAARAHITECMRCAAMWRFWSQTRGVWRATPTARVPSGLLLRILMACRLAALRRTRTGAEAQTSHGQESVPREMHAPLAAAFEVPPVPPHLRDAILQRTVGVAPAIAPPMILPEAASPRKSSWLSSVKISRATRWASAVAVPAALVWMATVAGESPQNSDTVLTSAATVRNQMTRVTSSDAPVARAGRPSAARAIAGSTQTATSKAPRGAELDSAGSTMFDADAEWFDTGSRDTTLAATVNEGAASFGETNRSTSVRADDAARRTQTMRIVSRPAKTWPTAEPTRTASTQEAVAWADAPAYAEGVTLPPTSVKLEASQTARPQMAFATTARPRIGLVRANFTPRISQPARGRGAGRTRLGGAESFGREALLKASTNAMRSRLRASDPLVDIPRRGTSNNRAEDAMEIDATYVADAPDGDDSRRMASSEADELRSIVNEYRATLMADEEHIGSAPISSSTNESL